MRRVAVLAIWILVSLPVRGQSINVDFHTGAGVPSATFSGAGLPGVWNGVTKCEPQPVSLVDLAGRPTGVSLLSENGRCYVVPHVAAASGDLGCLLNDYLCSPGPPLVLTFDGLTPGGYDVITYLVGRQDHPSAQPSYVNGDSSTHQTTVGVVSNALEFQMTHSRHRVYVSSGRLTVTVEAFGNDPCANGIQLVELPEIGDVSTSATNMTLSLSGLSPSSSIMLQQSVDLMTGAWHTVTSFVGSSSTSTIQLPATNDMDRVFYRVVVGTE